MDATSSSLLPILPRPSQTPAIHTTRLVLRPFQQDDLPVLQKLRSRPEVMRWAYQGRIDLTEQETRTWMQRFIYENDEKERRNYHFVVWRKESGEKSPPEKDKFTGNGSKTLGFIGVLGTVSLDKPDGPEVGYLFLPEAWGKGYATEALNGFTKAWWDLPSQTSLSPHSSQSEAALFAVTSKSNPGSANVLTKCGWSISGDAVEDIGGRQVELLKWTLKRPLQKLTVDGRSS